MSFLLLFTTPVKENKIPPAATARYPRTLEPERASVKLGRRGGQEIAKRGSECFG